jgi:hypothetical protein
VREGIQEDQVEIMIINLSNTDKIDRAKEIIRGEGLTDVSYYDVEGEIMKNYNVIGVPAAFYVDPDGIIKNISFGADSAEGILEKIEN